jgi:hypothetical protein
MTRVDERHSQAGERRRGKLVLADATLSAIEVLIPLGPAFA